MNGRLARVDEQGDSHSDVGLVCRPRCYKGQVRRPLFALVWQPLPNIERILQWSILRRHYQPRAKQAHIKRRRLRA
jgi:hypothetical protein